MSAVRVPDTLETLRTLLRMIEEKARLIQLLDDYISGDGVTVVIGSEHHLPDLQRFSLIACRYFDGHGTGAVGVIGPTRMRIRARSMPSKDFRRRSAEWSTPVPEPVVFSKTTHGRQSHRIQSQSSE